MRPITASDLMSPEVLTVREDLPVAELATFLVDNEISGAPVVDEEGRLVGVVSVTDIVAATSEEAEDGEPIGSTFYDRGFDDGPGEGLAEEVEELLAEEGEELVVGDIMTPTVYAVAEEAPVSDIASLMLDHHLHRVLVTREEQLVGIITTSDLLGLLVEEP